MITKTDIAIGATLGILSLNFLCNFATRKVDSYESNLLKGTAQYLQAFDGKNPKEALNYTLQTLDITRNFQKEKISTLEREVTEINSQIGESSQAVYKPAFENIAKKIENASDKKAYDLFDAALGLLTLTTTLTFLNRKKEE